MAAGFACEVVYEQPGEQCPDHGDDGQEPERPFALEVFGEVLGAFQTAGEEHRPDRGDCADDGTEDIEPAVRVVVDPRADGSGDAFGRELQVQISRHEAS